MIQPSILRTATAPVEVRISEVVLVVGVVVVGASRSISVSAILGRWMAREGFGGLVDWWIGREGGKWRKNWLGILLIFCFVRLRRVAWGANDETEI